MSRNHPNLVPEAQAEASLDYAKCRAMRHRFEPVIGKVRPRRNMFGVQIIFRCEHCGTLRFDIVSRLNGQVLARSYDHPHGYKDSAHHRDAAYWRAAYWDTLDREMFIDLEQVAADEKKVKVTPITKRKTA